MSNNKRIFAKIESSVPEEDEDAKHVDVDIDDDDDTKTIPQKQFSIRARRPFFQTYTASEEEEDEEDDPNEEPNASGVDEDDDAKHDDDEKNIDDANAAEERDLFSQVFLWGQCEPTDSPMMLMFHQCQLMEYLPPFKPDDFIDRIIVNMGTGKMYLFPTEKDQSLDKVYDLIIGAVPTNEYE